MSLLDTILLGGEDPPAPGLVVSYQATGNNGL